MSAPPEVRAAANKRRVHDGLARLANDGVASLAANLAALYAPDAVWRGSHPLDEMHGVSAIEAQVWQPLIAALPDLERREQLLIGGSYNGTDVVAGFGTLTGIFRHDWLGIPATGRTVQLRYAEAHEFAGERIARTTTLFDLLDLMRQAGVWPVAPSLGVEATWPSPFARNGISFDVADPLESAASLAQALTMQRALAYDADRAGLITGPDKPFWHDRMMWYGPAGVGTCRGVAGYVDGHQHPFRRAFPDRVGMNHYMRFGDGGFSATGGWPSVRATHSGSGFMGLGPTGRFVEMRVMDFYHHHEGLIRENWIPIDVIDMLRQMGVDVFGRMRGIVGRAG